MLACPGVTKGNVRVELYDMRKSSIIPAHESELSQIALNLDGTRLATASDKGTLIRVFDTHTGDILKELRSVVGEYARSMHGVCTEYTRNILLRLLTSDDFLLLVLLLASAATVPTLSIHVAASSHCLPPFRNVYNSSKYTPQPPSSSGAAWTGRSSTA